MTSENEYQNLSAVIRRNITFEKWNELQSNQQNMYLTYLTNPNHFFFRSSMIFQIKQTGIFTYDEEQMFLSRFKYFRDDLKIKKIPWGFFAIPFYGRAGYQCAAHYRELLVNKFLEPDPEYPFDGGNYPKGIFGEEVNLRPEIQEALENEAFQYVTSQLENEYIGDFEYPPSEFLTQNIPEKNRVCQEPKIAKKSLPRLKIGEKTRTKLPEPYIVDIDILDGALESDEEAAPEYYKKSGNKKQSDSSTSNVTPRHSSQNSAHPERVEEIRAAQTNKAPPIPRPPPAPRKPQGCSFMPGFIDPISKDPIVEPMMDPNGFVMGKKSWEKCLADHSIAPCPLEISNLSDLIALTKDNFDSLSAFISNMNQ